MDVGAGCAAGSLDEVTEPSDHGGWCLYATQMSVHVEVTGIGTASAVPDVVAVDLALTARETGVAAALSRAADLLSTAQQVARNHGIDGADIRSTGSHVHPVHDRHGEVTGRYEAGHRLRVRLRDRDRVGAILTDLSAEVGDALSVDSISLQIDDPAPLEQQARQAAFADARARAEQFAALAGRRLGKVRRIEDGPLAGRPRPTGRMLMESAGGDAALAPGESTVTATVRVRWGWDS